MSNEHNTNNNDSMDMSRETEIESPAENFGVLLEKSGNLPVRLMPGQKVRTRVVSITKDLIYVDLPGKTEGTVESKEFLDEDGALQVKEGDEIEAFYVTSKDGIRRLTTLINGYSPVKLRTLRDALEAGLPVYGEVKRAIKGGFEISVDGVKCFCPLSQIDLKGGREEKKYVGQSLPFMVLKYEDDGRNIVVSRRVLLEQEREARIERLKATIEHGSEVKAKVSSLQRFGAFVDLGGLDGLIPVSEISWERINVPGDLLSVGQEVDAKIISLDWDKNRLTLSMKALKPDPWATVSEKYPVDSRVSGTIVRLVPFGAFVRLESGMDGLIHISNLGAGRRINHPKEVVEVGQYIEAYVLSVDPEARKISLSVQPKVDTKKIELPKVGELLEGVVEKVMPYGIFLKLSSGLDGLVPNAEIGTTAGSETRQAYSPGTGMQVMVIDVDKPARKVRLSRKAVLEKEARTEYEEYMDSVKQQQGTTAGLGSLGEIIKAKMDEKKSAD